MVEPIVEVYDLKKYFPIYEGLLLRHIADVHAVNGVSFNIKQGETLGLVGESGCGKSTLGKTMLRLLKPTSGEVYFDGKNIFQLRKKELREIRARMQIIFQDPFASLNPSMTVFDILSEPFKIHHKLSKSKTKEKILEIIENVGLPNYKQNSYPHEFSGGQKQRIAIARAIALNPEFIVCDEPVSSLDISVRGQILNLLRDLQEKLKLTYFFISHDISVVKYMSNRIAIMYLGKIIEIGKTKDIFKDTMHPYTKALLSAVPIPDPDVKIDRILLKGEVSSPITPPSGCVFHPRCPDVMKICSKVEPEFFESNKKEHFTACHLF